MTRHREEAIKSDVGVADQTPNVIRGYDEQTPNIIVNSKMLTYGGIKPFFKLMLCVLNIFALSGVINF